MNATAFVNGIETFKDESGKLYYRPSGVKVGSDVGIIGPNHLVIITGTIAQIQIIKDEIWTFVDIGAEKPIPRKLNELAVEMF